MDKFFRELFLKGSMMYTLCGEKPMSGSTISIPDEKEWLSAAKPYLDSLTYQEKKETVQEMVEYCRQYDLHKNWEKWLEWKKQLSHPKVLFRVRPTREPKQFNIEMIHVQLVSSLLQKNKRIFMAELGMDFDPRAVALEFEDPESVFWNKVFDNHFLLGILYGYGQENSQHFAQEEESGPFSGIGVEPDGEGGSIEAIPLPTYRSYRSQDPLVKRYHKKRRKIQKDLKGKDLLDAILKRIFSS